MKERVYLFLFLLTISLAISSAATNSCSSTSQIMISLFDKNNSHGANWTDPNYNYKVCYDQVFGSVYAGANPQVCNGNNTVVNLSAVTNAHAGTGVNYPVAICYGNLQCQTRLNTCIAGETQVLTLSSNTNAHLAADNSYQYKVCCKLGLGSTVLSWQDYNGNTSISEAGKGWRVKLVYSQPGLPDGNVDFEIYEKDVVGDDAIRTGANKLTGQAVSGVAIAEWDITSADLNKTSDHDQFYFTANSQISPFLKVNTTWVNTRPTANITSPKNANIFYIKTPVSFSQKSYDKEGPVTLKWNISDNFIADTAASGFNHSYIFSGQKVITLRVTDKDGLTHEDQISILILNDSSSHIRPFIEKPKHKESVVSQTLIVSYNGSESFVVRSVTSGAPGSCTAAVDCLAGNCPATTSGSPNCSASPSSPITITGPRGIYNTLLYKWVINADGSIITISGLGKNGGSQGFASAGDKAIQLILNYSSGGINLQDSFTRDFTLYDRRQCRDNGATYVEIDSQGNEVSRQTTINSRACAGADQLAGNGDDCCPVGWSCSTSASSPGCQLNEALLGAQCPYYTDSFNCTEDPLSLARNDVLWESRGCGTTVGNNNTLCACTWEGNQCKFGKSFRGSIEPITTLSQCTYVTQAGECINGYQEIQITALLSSGTDPSCINSVETIPCGRPVVQLPFFGPVQFITAIVIIILIYLLYLKLRKNKTHKRKR